MATRSIFISYARKDRAQVGALSETLRLLGNQVWLDESLTGGAKWWAEILKQIEQCDIFLYVLSRSSLKSEACTAEKAYALDLRKPLLPVMVEPVGAASLPADLAQLHIVNYTHSGQQGVIRLVNAVNGMPEAVALPSPLPQKPPVPVSYLSQLGRQARDARTVDEQILVTSKLGAVAESDEDPEKRAEALAIIDDMARRHDLMAEAEHQIRIVKERLHAFPARPQPPQPPEAQQLESPEPELVEPQPAEPQRAEPQRAEPQRAEPQPAEPQPAEPQPAEPQPAEPQPAEPQLPESARGPGQMPPTPPPAVVREKKASEDERRRWLVPIIVCGALLLLVLLAVCVWAAAGGLAAQGDSSAAARSKPAVWVRACRIR